MKTFREIGIAEPILKAIEEKGFEAPTKIQEETIPLITGGKDVIGGSETGSGKTLAFGTAIIQNSEKGKGIQAVVLTPTRELAEQVAEALKGFSKHKPLDTIAIYGGVSINPQIEKLQRVEVVVGTPGRMLDHMMRNTINLKNVKTLVLDEADRMLDMGFVDDVEKIISQCPKQRQTMLFSATISTDIIRLAKRYMKDPVKVSADSYVDPKKLKQVYYDIESNLKFSLLVHLLKNERAGLAMVFCNTQRNTDFIANNLRHNRINAIAIHGGFSQDKRTKAMNDFNSKNIQILVCTDVAARGLDIKGVSHVYNYDIPKESKQYIHRIGRTARAGKEGKAVNILTDRDHDNFSRILRDYDLDLTKEQKPYIEKVKVKLTEERRYSRRPRGHFGDRNGGFSRRGPGRFGERSRSHSREGNRQHFGRRYTGHSGERNRSNFKEGPSSHSGEGNKSNFRKRHGSQSRDKNRQWGTGRR